MRTDGQTPARWRRGRHGGDQRPLWQSRWRGCSRNFRVAGRGGRLYADFVMEVTQVLSVQSPTEALLFQAEGRRLAAVVGELEVDAEVAGAELGDDLLQDVAVLGDDAYGVALDGGLDFELGLFDEGDDLAGGVGVDALLELDLLADGGVGGGLDLFEFQVLRSEEHTS